MIVVGISGKAHSGKDTMTDILIKKYGFIKMAFADHLKELVQEHYGFKKEELWTDYKTEEVRRILQGTGELIKSLEGDNFWIHEIQKKMVYGSMIPGWTNRVVISDVRFLNEKHFIEGCSGITIRIDRPDGEEIEFNPDHVSEKELQEFNYIVKNDRTIEELRNSIVTIMANENIS